MLLRYGSLLGLVILPALVLLLGAGEDKPPAPDGKPAPILQTKEAIVVDGVLDEPAWKTATAIPVQYIWGKVGERSTEPRMVVKYTWDSDYLYIGYETFDRNLVALGTGNHKGPKDNQRETCKISDDKEKVDVVEFFISFGDTRMFWELHHNAANHFSDILITVTDDNWPISKTTLARFGIHFATQEYVDDDVPAGKTLARAVKLKPKADGKPSTINDSSDVDTGYVGELRLPWLGLGAPFARETYVMNAAGKRIRGGWKMTGQEMMILAVFQDGDLKDHYHHTSPTKPGGWFHKGAEHWPRYVLEAGPEKKP